MSSTDEYLVGPTIGQGSFAHVVYAKHKRSEKKVAIKVLNQITLKRRPDVMQMVLTERNVLSQLSSSAYVVNLWASFLDSQCVYLVMELALGGDLQDLIQLGLDDSGNHNDEWQASIPFYARQLIQAIQYIHSKKILHCDLKPQNILIEESGKLKLADFGSAVDMSKNNDTGVAIVPRGTSQYSSPELLKGNPKLNVAVDLWSLGCVFYAFFNNESPFHAETESLTVQAIMEYSISGDKRSVCPSEYNFAHKWSKYIDGLLQHRLQIWKDLIMDSRDWEKPPDGLLLPEASWQEEVESTELKDGSLGWAMFEL